MVWVNLLHGTGTGRSSGGDVGVCWNVQWCVCSDIKVRQQVAPPGAEVLCMLLHWLMVCNEVNTLECLSGMSVLTLI